MKNITRAVCASLLALALIGGCRAGGQVPPTNHVVLLTWSAPVPAGNWAGCGTGQPACSYIISSIQVTGSTCPAPNMTTPNYTPINASTPATGTSFTDPNASGTTVCYISQTKQGGAVSGASNTTGPLVVPGNPLAPVLSGTSASLDGVKQHDVTKPAVPLPVMAEMGVPTLKAEVIGTR